MKSDRVGQSFVNENGCAYTIIKYDGCMSVMVEFQDEYKAKVTSTYWNCQNGKVNNPYTPTVYGYGFIGLLSNGTKPKTSSNGKRCREYVLWSNIMKRLFCESYHKENPSYIGLGYSKELLCYSYFLENVLPNIPNYECWVKYGSKFQLDKDILGAKNDRQGYYIENLMFVTSQSNLEESKLRHDGTGFAKKTRPVKGTNKVTGEVVLFKSSHEASRVINICQQNITRCCRGERKSAGGYVWEYMEEDER